jgi:hypothetical protein
MKTPKLTPAQLDALEAIIHEWDDTRDFLYWKHGVVKQGPVQVLTGTSSMAIVRNRSTLFALERLGMIVLDRRVERGDRVTIVPRNDPDGSDYAIPTALGRTAAKQG